MSETAALQQESIWRLSQGQATLLLVAVLTILRFALAPFIPLAFDEAYYWRWSTHLAAGYFDHPPMVAWLIALGTRIAGETEFGVRLVPLVLSIPASWAVWRSAVILFGDRALALAALVFFNLMLIVSVGTILATPDASLLVASAFLLFCLAKISATGRPGWWVAAGIVTGIGCLAKFTALFWLPSVLIWLLLTPRLRPWLATPWPWIGGMVAFVIFFPNLIWNANHDWVTFTKQFGRVAADGFVPEYLLEHLGLQVGMATPVIFVLGWLGLAAFLTRRGGSANARVMIGALIWPTTLFFLYFALRARVEGNWTGPIFSAFAIAAAAALHTVNWHGAVEKFVGSIRPWAVPAGLLVVLAIYGQTVFGWLPLGNWDPTASRLGAGIQSLAEDVEALREAEGATLILTVDYPMNGWLSFYSPADRAPVFQFNEPERWLQELPPGPAELAGPLLAILLKNQSIAPIEADYGPAEQVTVLTRRRGDLVIAEYVVYRLKGAAVGP